MLREARLPVVSVTMSCKTWLTGRTIQGLQYLSGCQGQERGQDPSYFWDQGTAELAVYQSEEEQISQWGQQDGGVYHWSSREEKSNWQDRWDQVRQLSGPAGLWRGEPHNVVSRKGRLQLPGYCLAQALLKSSNRLYHKHPLKHIFCSMSFLVASANLT